MKDIKDNKTQSVEHILSELLHSFLVTPYNWSLVGLAAFLWSCVCYFGYFNTNFDMISSVSYYIMLLSLVTIIIGFTKKELGTNLVKLGIVTELVNIFSLCSSKSVVFQQFGIFILLPICLFLFLLQLKNLLIVE